MESFFYTHDHARALCSSSLASFALLGSAGTGGLGLLELLLQRQALGWVLHLRLVREVAVHEEWPHLVVHAEQHDSDAAGAVRAVLRYA